MAVGTNGSTAFAPLTMVVTTRNFADLSHAAPARVGPPKPDRKWMIAFIVLAAMATLAWMRFVDIYGPQDDSASLNLKTITVLSSLLGVLLMLGGIVVWHHNQLKAFAERAVRDGGVVVGPRTLSISDDGITIDGETVRSLTRWSAIQEISEPGETILIWTDPGAAILVPKSAFATNEARQNFVAEILKRIQKKSPA